ncbi:type IX secretion system protein PorQ [Ekhidna sp.]
MKYIFLIAFLIPIFGLAQIGGQSGYQSLNLTSNPRAAALGGTTISLVDGDVSQFFENPATLDSISAGNVFFHFNPYFADVFVYSGAYSFSIGNAGVFAAGIHYINYGAFDLVDETGAQLGSFRAQDYTFSIGKAHQIGVFSLGTNLKLTHSSIESYGSTAILVDIGGVFRINRNWSAAMVLKNMGFRISEYTQFSNPELPFDVKIGMSFKPEYMPLRFTLTSTNLTHENSSGSESSSGRSVSTFNQLFNRVNLGAEFLLSDNFQLLVGYNHKRKQELKLDDIGGGAGFSFGLMAKVKKVEIRFSRATFHTAGGSSFISLKTNLNDFKKIL